MIHADHNYRVCIPLKTKDIYDVDSRLDKIRELIFWINQLVEWQTDQYSFHTRYTSDILDVWFKDEKHAIMCVLMWS